MYAQILVFFGLKTRPIEYVTSWHRLYLWCFRKASIFLASFTQLENSYCLELWRDWRCLQYFRGEFEIPVAKCEWYSFKVLAVTLPWQSTWFRFLNQAPKSFKMPISMGVGMKRKRDERVEQKRQDVRPISSFETKRVSTSVLHILPSAFCCKLVPQLTSNLWLCTGHSARYSLGKTH